MRYLNWTRAAILYEDEFGLVRLQVNINFSHKFTYKFCNLLVFHIKDLVRMPPTKNLELYIRQTNPENYRYMKTLNF